MGNSQNLFSPKKYTKFISKYRETRMYVVQCICRSPLNRYSIQSKPDTRACIHSSCIPLLQWMTTEFNEIWEIIKADSEKKATLNHHLLAHKTALSGGEIRENWELWVIKTQRKMPKQLQHFASFPLKCKFDQQEIEMIAFCVACFCLERKFPCLLWAFVKTLIHPIDLLVLVCAYNSNKNVNVTEKKSAIVAIKSGEMKIDTFRHNTAKINLMWKTFASIDLASLGWNNKLIKWLGHSCLPILLFSFRFVFSSASCEFKDEFVSRHSMRNVFALCVHFLCEAKYRYEWSVFVLWS